MVFSSVGPSLQVAKPWPATLPMSSTQLRGAFQHVETCKVAHLNRQSRCVSKFVPACSTAASALEEENLRKQGVGFPWSERASGPGNTFGG